MDNPYEQNPYQENPYQSPETPVQPPDGMRLGALPHGQRSPGMVGHVRVVAILMIIQGAFELLASVGLIAIATLFPLMIAQSGPPGQGPSDAEFWIVLVVYGGMGLMMLVLAVLHIFAGWRNYHFRSRTLGIVAMSTGLLTLITCYCLPTALGLMIYGLIVYLNQEVTEAFSMGEAGYEPRDILNSFGR